MQRECEPTRWSAHAGSANGTKEGIKSLNVYFDSAQAKVYEAHRSLLNKKEPITVENMKAIILLVASEEIQMMQRILVG